MALSVKWDELPQATSCGEFLAIRTHTSPHKHIQHKVPLPIQWTLMDILLQPGRRTHLPPVIEALAHDCLTCDMNHEQIHRMEKGTQNQS